MKRLLKLAMAVLFTVLTPVQSAKVKLWHQHEPSHFEKAKLDQIVISSEGTLRLSHQLKPLATDKKLAATYIWDMKEDAHGNLYLATGNEGRIYRITPTGKVSVVYDSKDSQILCLALDKRGNVYAGTGPSGNVIRVSADGKAKVISRGLSSYVWSLALSTDAKKLYAGTGPNGKVYEVTSDGDSRVLYKSRQDHILCVAVSKDHIYAGTDKRGLVYRITPQGKAFVLYQAAQSEVRTLEVIGDGLYVGTSTPTEKKFKTKGNSIPGALSERSQKPDGRVAVTSYKFDAEKVELASKSSSSSSSKSSDEDEPTPSRSSPSEGENSLYHISRDGTVREMLREQTMILSVLPQKSKLFVGTGSKGQLLQVDAKTREQIEIARLDHGQILSLLQRKDGSILVGTGDPGRLYVLKQEHASRGTVVSEVYDAKIISKWGSLRWQSDTPKGTSVTVAVRSGNVAEPDETWSAWSKEQTNSDQAVIEAPKARYLQYRLTLSTTDASQTPSVRSVALRYRTTNQAPEVTKIEVPNLDAEEIDAKKVKLKWKATDANEDSVRYSIFARKEGWENWIELADEVTKTTWTWDTTTAPSGRYRVKIVASDHRDNPKSEALTGSRVSAPFVVNHQPPAVTVKVIGIQGDQVQLEAKATSPLSRLVSASFAINGQKWTNVFPKDQLFDSRSETFRFTTRSLKPGSYVVMLKLKDASGNTGTGDVVLTVKAKTE